MPQVVKDKPISRLILPELFQQFQEAITSSNKKTEILPFVSSFEKVRLVLNTQNLILLFGING
ncbi:hypothetical protein DSO57_1029273 [Entomophthora muscae]|uniref:Uncharacterized protein n=1 Tax=Entomophthora muscae TaxID=34485 RepID=A0ACC2TZV7_9FUNG|nr:hypothetical protein DSO57_1029273 [Entomophthora muscae]